MGKTVMRKKSMRQITMRKATMRKTWTLVSFGAALFGSVLAGAAAADTVALKAANGRYLSAGERGSLLANASRVGRREAFELVRLGEDRYGLRSHEGFYVSASSYGGELEADRRDAGDWESFRIVRLGGIRVALEAHDGRFVTVGRDGRLAADRADARSQESFELSRLEDQEPDPLDWLDDDDDGGGYGDSGYDDPHDDGPLPGLLPDAALDQPRQTVLWRVNDGRFVRLDRDGDRLRADGRQASEDARFEVLRLRGGGMAIRAANGLYVSAREGVLKADAFEIGRSESFVLERRRDGSLTLRAWNGRYLSAEDGGGGELLADRDEARSWETFRLAEARGLAAPPPVPPPTAAPPATVQTSALPTSGSRVAFRSEKGFYVSVGLDGRLRADRTEIGERQTFRLDRLGGNEVALRTHDGRRYVSNRGGALRADAESVGDDEVFVLQARGRGTFTLRSLAGTYMSAEGGGGREITIDRREARGWETFRLEVRRPSAASDRPGVLPTTQSPPPAPHLPVDRARVALRSERGYYLSIDGNGRLIADRREVGQREAFTVLRLGDDKVALRAWNGRYLSAADGGGGELLADRQRIYEWESFRLKPAAGGKVAMMTSGGKYISADQGGGGGVVANRDQAKGWESFELLVLP